MSDINNDKLESMLRKVQALLRQADDPGATPEEAETFREKAEALMYRYRIDEAMLGSTDTDGAGAVPEWKTFTVCSRRSEFSGSYRAIFGHVLSHFECRGVFRYEGDDILCEAVGYRGELRMTEALYTSCMLAFGMKLEPVVDPSLSDQVNAYNLRSAGVEGKRIALMLWPEAERDPHDGYPVRALRVKARGLFKKEAIARGEDPSVLLGKGNSVSAYREDFATAFANEIWHRLARMRSVHGEMNGAMVLAGRKEATDEALYERYPKLRPRPLSEQDRWVDPRDNCEKCKKAKSGYCREHAYLKPRAGGYGRRVNYSAVERGRGAAQAVDLGPGSGSNKVPGTATRGELT